MLIRGELPPYYTAPEIINDTRGLFVNAETLELSYYQKSRMEKDPRWCDLTDIFQRKVRSQDVVRGMEAQGTDVDRQFDDLLDDNMRAIELIVDREFPEQIIPAKATIREAIDIFYKVNASGVALTDAELALAQISGYWPEARDLFKDKLAKLAAEGFVLKLDFIVYALLGCLHHMGSDMRRLHGEGNKERIQDAWDVLDRYALDFVMNLLRTRAYVDHTTEINSIYALIPIIVFFHDRQGQTVPEDQLWRIIKWFYYSQIRARYVSQLPQKLDFDLRIIAESERPFEELLGIIAEERRLEILPDEFVGRAISHPLFGLVRWYIKSRGAVCFTTGLGLHRNMGDKYQLENDHIFPYSRLKKAGYGKGNRIKYALAQELTNRAVLTQIANRQKSASPAAAYLRSVRENSPDALAKQCIPEDESLWGLDRYEEFLAARRLLLSARLNEYLDGFTTTDDEVGAATLEELIVEGESEELEFKSSLRWDYKQGRVNEVLESVVVKTVAAFSNSAGGTLLIGVDDSGEALGLDNDYASLRGDRDRFELHLRNFLNEHLGKGYVAQSVKVLFPSVGDVEICQVDVLPSSTPQVVKLKGESERIHEAFYVRSGNSSQELSVSDFDVYRQDRFV